MDTMMNKDVKYVRRSSSNVISMRFDAAFFYERGVRFLERNDLRRALKAFRKTVEYEPQNPINHCNLAGVLSELGDFEGSNQVLLHVLQAVDPSMSECQFYLANNYANMGEYATAEEYVLRYLDSDPDGEYADDAEEMLGVLMDEFGGGKAYAEWEQKRRDSERAQARRDGRHLLEEGQFEAAVEWLEAVVKREPSNTAAHNNLSLAYYYTGQYNLAIATTEGVLANHPHNMHALCNLAVYSAQLGPKDRLQSCIDKLKKVFPLHYDQAMKVGTTLGLVGEHYAAFQVFLRLVRVVERPEPVLLHSLAASAANIGRLQLARKWWKVLSQAPEMTEVANYYLDELDKVDRQGKRAVRVSYQNDLPLHVQFAEMKKRLRHGDLSLWQHDPLLRASLYWGLRHGTSETRKAVIRTLALISDADAEKALRLFLKRTDIDETMQAAALFALRRSGCRGRVELFRNGSMDSQRMSDVPKDVILGIDPLWREVWNLTDAWLRQNKQTKYVKQAKQVWVSFLEKAFLRTNLRIVKPEIWVAGLVYTVTRSHQEPVRQKDIAGWFGVSVSSLGKASSRLEG